ncbi:helix-turn-helix domain-containing protein [Thiomicrospira cyclica]|uniref:Uncharacterized protein n=1 Tax=Thiomicrospira cyclica (strain DSM 14477 / JCM 11371 / ALM1) TaxID=717773 RepID=F6DCF1_THICA|nr:hypothetical protein [Thiomicrospira cyclica]AEG31537.1 hypothetical protein Thicy_0765 [Thiomicrospira cyclica ALM1]
MNNKTLDYLKNHTLIKKAIKDTGLEFHDLLGFSVKPFIDDGLVSWIYSPGAECNPPENWLDAEPALILIWFYSDQSDSESLAYQDASKRLQIAELGLTYTTTTKARSQGGKSTAKDKKDEASIRREKIRALFFNDFKDRPERNRAAPIAARLGITAKTVRSHIKIIKEETH